MNEQQVVDHLRSSIPQEQVLEVRGRLFGGLFGGGIKDKIINALGGIVGTAGIDVEVVIAAARKYYDQLFAAGDNPSLPNWLEDIVESLIWMGIERAIRKLFANQPMP